MQYYDKKAVGARLKEARRHGKRTILCLSAKEKI